LAGIVPKVKGVKTIKRTVTKEEAEKLASELNAIKYMECHLLQMDTVAPLFEEAIRTGVAYKQSKTESSSTGRSTGSLSSQSSPNDPLKDNTTKVDRINDPKRKTIKNLIFGKKKIRTTLEVIL